MGKWRNYVEKLKETCKNNKKKVIGICTGLMAVISYRLRNYYYSRFYLRYFKNKRK